MEIKYKPSPKGPKFFKKEFTRELVNEELYNKFISNTLTYKDITFKEFKELWEDIAFTIRKEIVENPLGVKLGAYAGELKLQYLPHKFKAIDTKTTNEEGKVTYYVNINNKGKVATIKWERRWAVKFNKMLQFFAFIPNYKINRLAVEYITKYPEKLRVSRNTLGGYSVWRQYKRESNANKKK